MRPSLILLHVPLLHILAVLAVGLQELVPPGEGRGVVPHKVHVVEVMEASASIERDEMQRVPRDVITTESRNQIEDVLQEYHSVMTKC